VNPSVLVAFELDGQADGGRDEGVYLQIGLTPGVHLQRERPYPVTLTLPLVLRLSLGDYYERVGVGGDDDTFGYFSASLAARCPSSVSFPRMC
jgi:hypothetical protein